MKPLRGLIFNFGPHRMGEVVGVGGVLLRKIDLQGGGTRAVLI